MSRERVGLVGTRQIGKLLPLAASLLSVYVGDKPFAAALIFVRWSPDGTQPVGHLETDLLVHAHHRSEAKAAIHELTLHEVKDHLQKLIEQHKELPDW